jgi:hypothetical protein
MNTPGIFYSLALAILVIMVFLSGCIGWDYVPNRDFIVVKLHPDGSTAWTRTIDTGYDDSATIIAQIKNGDLLIAAQNTSERSGPSHSYLLRLSGEGTTIVEMSVDDYPRLSGITPTRDGGFATTQEYGGIRRYGPDGKFLWDWNTGPDDDVWSYRFTGATIETLDGGFAMAGTAYHFPGGAVITKLDSEGVVAWKERIGDAGAEKALSVAEFPDGSGYLASTVRGVAPDNGTEQRYSYSAVWLAANGTTIHTTQIGITRYPPQVISMRLGADEDCIIYRDDMQIQNNTLVFQLVAVVFDRNGTELDRKIIDADPVVSMTNDRGYFSAGLRNYSPEGSGLIHIRKYNPDGQPSWDRDIPDVISSRLITSLQTSDGGNVILALKENR